VIVWIMAIILRVVTCGSHGMIVKILDAFVMSLEWIQNGTGMAT